MAIPKGVWGIDIGQCALKALRVELQDGQVHATAFDYIEHPKILSQPDADPDQLTREALDQFLSRNSLKGDFVAISVPGQAGLARFVKLPPVEEKKVGDIVRFEAKQQIPFPLEEVVWDYQKIGSGEVTDGFAMETEIGLFAMKRDIISRGLQHYQDVGIEVDAIQMAPLALCNYVSYELLGKGGPSQPTPEDDDTPRGKRKCIVALDIGADASNLVVTDGEKIIWQRPIPLGGNHLTRALSKELKLTFAKAEHLKRNAAKSPPDLKQILTALRPVLTDMVGEVQRSLGYFTGAHREAHVAYLVGLGSAFRLPGLQKYLAEKLGIEVKKPTKFERLFGDEVTGSPVFSENLLGFAVTYGLAVQGIKVLAKPGEQFAKLTTNLLPPEIRKERMIRAKKPWAIAAAAMMFAGSGVLTTGHAWRYHAVNAPVIQDGMAKASEAMKNSQKRDGEISAKDAEVKETDRAVNSIVAGKDEQIDWIRLNEYINRALPRPDGKNLPLKGNEPKPGGKPGEMVPNQVGYWATGAAREAATDFYDREKGSESADVPINDAVREHLCHVDVESIATLYTPNLKQFYDIAKKTTADQTGAEFRFMLNDDVNNPPKDGEGGWVVAISGSTYQEKGPIFLRDTLVYNLARMCNRTFGASAPPPAPNAAAGKTPEDPITNRVTDVFLYNCWTVDDPKPGTFEHLSTNYLKPLMAGHGDAGAAYRDAWTPLVAGAANNAPTTGGPIGPQPGGGGTGIRRGAPRPGGDSLPRGGLRLPPTAAPPPPPVPGGTDTAGTLKSKPRYEFVVMFIWREPTPSDRLAPAAAAPPASPPK